MQLKNSRRTLVLNAVLRVVLLVMYAFAFISNWNELSMFTKAMVTLILGGSAIVAGQAVYAVVRFWHIAPVYDYLDAVKAFCEER